MTKRRLFATIALISVMFVAIGGLMHFWIRHSEAYELGRAAVAGRLGVSTEMVQLKLLAPLQVLEGAYSGSALFVLCGPDAKCVTVVARKEDARWSVVDLAER